MSATMVVGVDGSAHAERAVAWCAAHAAAFDATVVAVHVIETPAYGSAMGPYVSLPPLTATQLDELRDVVARDWCKPLADAGIAFRVALMEGSAARAIMDAADKENAELVVTGRRGRGGFAELLLGSTSHHLSHHLARPLVIVP